MALLQDFKKFALRGNLIDLAIGFTVGAAFSTVAKSLVDDLIMPPLGLILGRTDFSDYYLLLRDGPEAPGPYATREAAEAAGAVLLDYGQFVTSLLTFLVVAIAMFVVVRSISRATEALQDEFGQDEADEPQLPTTKKCAYCREVVPYKASRCSHCTSFLGTEGGPLNPDQRLTPGEVSTPVGGATGTA